MSSFLARLSKNCFVPTEETQSSGRIDIIFTCFDCDKEFFDCNHEEMREHIEEGTPCEQAAFYITVERACPICKIDTAFDNAEALGEYVQNCERPSTHAQKVQFLKEIDFFVAWPHESLGDYPCVIRDAAFPLDTLLDP